MMMRKAAVVALILSVSAAKALGAVAWQGEAVIDTATTQCTATGIVANTVIKSVLQPKNITGNTANTIVTFNFNSVGMFAMILDKGAMPNGTAATFGNNASGVLKANVGIVYKTFVQTPTTIVETTPDARLNGQILNFMFIPNCTVTFRAAYTKNTSN